MKINVNDSSEMIKKILTVSMVIMLMNVGFTGLFVKPVAAETVVPSQVIQIAEQYKKNNEIYYLYLINDKDPFADDTAIIHHWYLVMYCLIDTNEFNKRKITGTLVIDASNYNILTEENLPSLDIFYVPAFAFYATFDENAVLQDEFYTYAEQKAKESLQLHLQHISDRIQMEEALEDSNYDLFARVSVALLSAGLGVYAAGIMPAVTPLLFNFDLTIIGMFSSWMDGNEIKKVMDAKVYQQQMINDFSDASNLCGDLVNIWITVSDGSYKQIKNLIPGSGGYENTYLLEIGYVLNGFYGIAELANSQESMDKVRTSIEIINQQRRDNNIIKDQIMLFYNSLSSNYRFIAKTSPASITESVTSNSISITATYTGNDDNDGSALLYYKSSSSSTWISVGNMAKAYLNKQYSKTISGLSPTTSYDVKVEYSDPDGVSGTNPIYKYNIKTAQLDCIPPQTPTLYDPGTVSTSGNYMLHWTYQVDATAYVIEEVGKSTNTYTSTVAQYAVSGKENGDYTYRVKACKDCACSDWSNTQSITVSKEPVSDYSYDGNIYYGSVSSSTTSKEYVRGSYKVKVTSRQYTSSTPTANVIVYKNGVPIDQSSISLQKMVYFDDNNDLQVFLKDALVDSNQKYLEWIAISTKTDASSVKATPMELTLAPGQVAYIDLTFPSDSYDEHYFDGGAKSWAQKSSRYKDKITVPTSTSEGRYLLSVLATSGGGVENSPGDRVCSVKDIIINVISPNHAPDIPSNPNPNNVNNMPIDQISFDWDCSDSDSGDSLTYDLYLDSNADPIKEERTGLTSSSVTLTNLNLNYGQQYYWKVVATDNHDVSTVGPVWSFVTKEKTNQPPLKPANPVPVAGATGQSVNNLQLNWNGGDPDEDAVIYNIYAGLSSGTLNLLGSTTSTSYTIPGLEYSTTYYWKVVANDGIASPVEGSLWNFRTQDKPNNAPYVPSLIFPENQAEKITINTFLYWSGGDPDENDVLTYKVYLDTNPAPSTLKYSGTDKFYSLSNLVFNERYYWKVVVTDTKGASTQSPVWSFTTETIDNPPVANAGADKTATVGSDVTFDGTESTDDKGIASYSWDFGDGTTAIGVAPTHKYTTAGTYTATLTVTDTAGQKSTDTLQVTVNPIPVDNPPVANAGADKTTTVGSDLTFDGSASTDDKGIASYTWNFGDGATATGVAPTHKYTAAGTYTVTLTVTDTSGQKSSDTLQVTVNPSSVDNPPVANAGADKTTTVGSDLTFDGSASTDDKGIASYAWNFGDGATTTGVGPTHKYTAAGTYTVTLTVTDTAGQKSTDTLHATVNPSSVDNPPIANAGADKTTTVGADVTFDGSASIDDKGIASYEWNFGDGTTATGIRPTHKYAAAGTYTVTLTVTDTAGKKSSDTLQISVNDSGSTVSYTPTFDNRLRSDTPTSVLSTTAYLDIGRSTSTSRDVMIFDLSSYKTTDTISKATLSLYWYYPAGKTRTSDTVVEVYRPVEWDPRYVTWNSRASGTLWSIAGGNWYDKNGAAQGTTPYASVTFRASTLPDNKYYEFDVTQLVQEYVSGKYKNTGFFLKARTESGNYIAFYSSEYSNTAMRPKLTITATSGSTPTDNPPIANAGADKTATVGSDVTFDGTASTDDKGIASYSWDFGDSSTATGVSPTHKYTAAGTYTVTLTLTDTAAQKATDTLQVTVSNAGSTVSYTPTYDNRLRSDTPTTVLSTTAYIDIGRSTPTSRDVMIFDLSSYKTTDTISKATLSLYWYYPAGKTRTSDTVVEVYRPLEWDPNYVTWNSRMSGTPWTTAGGNWYDKNGVDQGTTPYASVTFPAGRMPDNKYYEFDVTQLVQEYVSGEYKNTGFFLKAKTESGNYIAFYSADATNADVRPKLTISASSGSTPTDNPPVANAGADKTATVGSDVTFDGSASTDDKGIASYSWDFGDVSTATGVSPTHKYATSGTYTVTLTVTDTAGQKATDALQVTVSNAGSTVSYTPTYDNRLRSDTPTTVLSTTAYLDIGKSTPISRDVMIFDLSSYKSTVAKATLYLDWYYPAGKTRTSDTVVEVYRPVEWDPKYVTWNSRASGTLWSTAGGNWYDKNAVSQGTAPYASVTFSASTLPDNKYYEFDVTQLVQEYVSGKYKNTGFFLKAKTESGNYIAFYSADASNAAVRPKLTITS